MPVRMEVTAGTVADCAQAEALIDGIAAEYLLAARGYDTNRALAAARARGMAPVIPPKRSRKSPQSYDAALYQTRHLCGEQVLQVARMAWCGDAVCQEGGVPGDLPDTRPGAVGQSNLTTRIRMPRFTPYVTPNRNTKHNYHTFTGAAHRIVPTPLTEPDGAMPTERTAEIA